MTSESQGMSVEAEHSGRPPMDREAELLPCPVCGNQPKWRGSQTDYRVGIFRLQCIGETHLFQSYGATQEIAITAWNTRQSSQLSELRKAAEGMAEALAIADDAIREMFRYYDGGETRGSYDGRPERNQLRKAGYVTRTALSQYRRES